MTWETIPKAVITHFCVFSMIIILTGVAHEGWHVYQFNKFDDVSMKEVCVLGVKDHYENESFFVGGWHKLPNVYIPMMGTEAVDEYEKEAHLVSNIVFGVLLAIYCLLFITVPACRKMEEK